MGKEICIVCGREIDSRGMSGHMKTHKAEPEGNDNDGVISYPSNEQKIEETNTVVDLDVPQGKRLKKPVASKPASSPASSPASKPDPRGQHNSGAKRAGHPNPSGVTEAEHKEEWKGFFRE